MGSNLLNHSGMAGLIVCAICVTGSDRANAQWGSIRANNRSGHETHQEAPRREAPRGQEREQIRERGPVERGPVVGAERREEGRHMGEEAREPRRFDFDEDRRHGFFWSGISPGMFFGTLPAGYVPLNVGNNPYYYYQGAYYEQAPSGYTAVAPPVGAVVPGLPPGAEPIPMGGNTYYYAGGAFYIQGPQGFTIVPPPLGVTISELPPGATPVYIRGALYYQAEGAYFLPSMQGGVTVYTTVQP